MTLNEIVDFLKSKGVTGDMEIRYFDINSNDKIEDLEVRIVDNSFEVN